MLKTKVLANSMSGEGLIGVWGAMFVLSPLTKEGGKGSLELRLHRHCHVCWGVVLMSSMPPNIIVLAARV